MTDPYAAMRVLAAKLEAEGHEPDHIVDAMLCVGMNAGFRLGGHDQMISFLERMIEIFQARADGRTTPSQMTQ
jgi:hypothetical protein